MSVIGLRQLSRATRDVVEQLERDGEPVVITRHGKPVATLTPVSQRQIAPLALAVAPELIAGRERAADAIRAGEGKPTSQLLEEIDAEDAELDTHTSEPEEIGLPASLVERMADAATADIPGQIAGAEPIHLLVKELLAIYLRASMRSAVERLRTVNENILADVGDDPGESTDEYARRLEDVTAAERLTVGAPAVM